MTAKEAAIVSAYTGFFIGEFSELHKYITELLGRPVFTHELADRELIEQIHELSKNDFINLKIV